MERPNVLLIISDDQGFGDFGFTGNTLASTPQLDRLAGDSAVYRNFVVAPACSPTRAALLTGRDHLLTGVWGVGPRANLREDETRMPRFFQAAGYRTAHIGKLDCAKVGKKTPSDFGWDWWLGNGKYDHHDPLLYEPGRHEKESGWTVDLYTQRAQEFIRANRDKPWFLSLAYITPHLPWHCDPQSSERFLTKGASPDLAECYGMIAQMDAAVGRLLETLQETSQEKRTIVVFLSDNGPNGPETMDLPPSDQVPGEDWRKRNIAGLRGYKPMVWENGILSPLLIRWPGRIPPGGRKQFATVEDLLPTLLDLAGISNDMVPHLPFTGISIRESLKNAAAKVSRPPALRLAIAGPGAARGGPPDMPRPLGIHHVALRGERFKYHSLPGGKHTLYDLQADPGETTDVSSKHPNILARMAGECEARWREVLESGRAFAAP